MSIARKVVKRHLRRVARRALRRMKIRRIVRRGRHVKKANFLKPRFGSIMLA